MTQTADFFDMPLPAEDPSAFLSSFRETWHDICKTMAHHDILASSEEESQRAGHATTQHMIHASEEALLYPLSLRHIIEDEAMIVSDARERIYRAFRQSFSFGAARYRHHLRTLLKDKGRSITFNNARQITRDFDTKMHAIQKTFESHVKDIVCYSEDHPIHPRATQTLSGQEIIHAYEHYKISMSVIQRLLSQIEDAS
ncbi:MAG: hypothetical protein GDA54_00395 [Alphaproteobacteria bacterium GM7ARS4]|nr:hypothetical protein [Alphaproteobacteria bacterium GM7ARS4]